MFCRSLQPLWGEASAAPPWVWGAGGWKLGRKHVLVRVNSGPWGSRRLTAAASCLSCFVKAANLPFVAADSGDKRERKWRFSCDGNRIRSAGGGGGGGGGRGSPAYTYLPSLGTTLTWVGGRYSGLGLMASPALMPFHLRRLQEGPERGCAPGPEAGGSPGPRRPCWRPSRVLSAGPGADELASFNQQLSEL